MTRNELIANIVDRKNEQLDFAKEQDELSEYQHANFHRGKANGFDEVLELLNELDS